MYQQEGNRHLAIGKNIIGMDGKTIGGSGCHIVLRELYLTENSLPNYNFSYGSIRINREGTIDISGYGAEVKNFDSAYAIQKIINDIAPELNTRVTDGRLTELTPL